MAGLRGRVAQSRGGRVRTVSLVAGGLVVAVAAVSAFHASRDASSGGNDAASTTATRLVITPRDGIGTARPDLPVSVQVSRGTLRSVTVTPQGTLAAAANSPATGGAGAVEGALSPD